MTTPDQENPKTDTPISTFKADPRSTLAQLPPAAGAMFHSALGGTHASGNISGSKTPLDRVS